MWQNLLSRTSFSSRRLVNQGLTRKAISTCVSQRQQDAVLSKPPTEGGAAEERIFPSSFSDVVIPERVHFTQHIFDVIEKHAGLTSMVCSETGQSWTFEEVRDLSLRLGSALARLGYSKGDVIGVVSPNCPEYVNAFLGMSCIGVIPSTFNFAFTSDEIRYQITNSDCVGMLCHEEKLPVVMEACRGNPAIRHIISIGSAQDGVLSLHDLCKDDGKGRPKTLEINPAEDILVLPYSSGTTGLPKGVMLTHRNALATLSQCSHPEVSLYREGFQDVTIGVLPMYHIFGLAVSIIFGLSNGATVVTMKEFNKYKYIDAVKKYQASILPTVPPLLSFLESSELAPPSLLKNVTNVVCGAAPVGESLIEKFQKKFGTNFEFREGYGLTETCGVTHITPRNGFVVGSCGKTVPNTFTKLVDPITGASVGINEPGEICIKGPQVMKGYLKNPKATMETFRDGWFHTGDVGTIDSEERVFIVDRIKELIKVKGFQVAPAELENLLREHPGVDDVAVVGVPDERSGEVPRAFVVQSKIPGGVSEDDLKKFVSQRVSPYKQLESVVFLEEIPKSASGKILRRELRDRMR